MAPSKRFNGGIFGNTVGSDTNAASIYGIYSMSQQYFMKQEGGWEPPPVGSEYAAPAQDAAEVAARVDSPSSGYYFMQHPNARSGATGVYVNYCLFGDTNKHHGQAWNLAMHIRNDQNSWKTYSGAATGTNQSAYSWDKWASGAPNNFASNQFTDPGGNTRDKFDYSQSCIGYGYFIPFTKFMIMTYSDHTTSFDNPGATAYYSRSSSSGTLRDLVDGANSTVWSTGGRQGLYSSGDLSGPSWNSNRTDQAFTGNPWTMSGNTVGNHNISAHALDSFDIVFNTNSNSSAYKTDADSNYNRITTTMCNNSLSGNAYGHTMQHGLGLWHAHSGYNGSKMYSLGQDAYCDNNNSHTASNDNYSGNAFCQGSSGMNTTHYGFSLWVA